jgi:hypothetical protein
MSKERSWLDFTAFDRKFEFVVNVGRVAFGGIFMLAKDDGIHEGDF